MFVNLCLFLKLTISMSRLLLLTASMMWFSTLKKKMVGKGRDVGLNQITLFEGKVADGNGEQVNLAGMFLGFCVQIRFGVRLWLYFREEASRVYSLEDGPAHAVWRNIGLSATILAISNKLGYDSTSVIICAIGSRYNSYCLNIARTFLIDATATQSKAYEVLLKAHEAAIGALKAGNKVSVVYQAAVSVVERDAPEFASHLTKSAGTGIGLEFRESGLSLNARNDWVLKPGMVFNVSLGFQNLQSETNNSKTKMFSLLLADTIIVNEKAAEVVTSISSKLVKDVAYSFNEEEEEEEECPKGFHKSVVAISNQTSRSSLVDKLKKSVDNEIHFLKGRVLKLKSDLVSKSIEVTYAVSRKEEALSSVFAKLNRLKKENSVKARELFNV